LKHLAVSFFTLGYYLLLFADFLLTSQECEPSKRKQKKKNYQGEQTLHYFDILLNATRHKTRQRTRQMKKAFTMIELVFVIVVIGILATAIIPRTRTNHNAETAIDLMSKIRYTQHLAMINDKYDRSDDEWFMKRWSIVFNGTTYSILSNGVYAKDPLTKKDLNAIDLKIDSLAFSGGCSNQNIISFDHLGRPLIGDLSLLTKPYSDTILLKTPCIITLKNSGEADEVLTMQPETGYIKR